MFREIHESIFSVQKDCPEKSSTETVQNMELKCSDESSSVTSKTTNPGMIYDVWAL